MQPSRKLLLGLLSFVPLVLMVVYMIVFFRLFVQAFQQDGNAELLPQLIFDHIGFIVIFSLLTSGFTLGLLIYFIIHASGNKALDSTERIVWILIFVFAGMLGFPIYWFMRIWNQPVSPHTITHF